MKTTVKMIIMSHLSDIQVGNRIDEATENSIQNDKINFCKFLLIWFPNTEVEIDPDVEYQKYLATKKNVDLTGI